MFNIRFHGRGGQGMKTAGRLLGTAFFLAGFEVQDAPRYGAERRGAPMSSYVRAGRQAIHARGVIVHPDLVVVADDTLVPIPAAGVLVGLRADTVLLLISREPESVWRERLHLEGPIVTLTPPENGDDARVSAVCAGAAACLTGVIDKSHLSAAVAQELEKLGSEALGANLETALESFDAMQTWHGLVKQSETAAFEDYRKPALIDLPLEAADKASATVRGAATSVMVKTGLWRSRRPVIDYAECHRCWWVCSSFCPDSAVNVGADGFPAIDYEHCKGCMICVAQCPSHAIASIPEAEARQRESEGEKP